MKSSNILNQINFQSLPDTGFRLIDYEEHYWGRDSDGNLVFALTEDNDNEHGQFLKTRYLKLFINNHFEISNSSSIKGRFTIMVLDLELDFDKEFIEIVLSYLKTNKNSSLIEFFIKLSALLSQDRKASKTELIGLYGELLLILCLKNSHHFNLLDKYQSVDKSIFDFSISESIKIEVKSTTRSQRIHHFKLNQVHYKEIQVYVASLLLQSDDSGTSLQELVDRVIYELSPSIDFVMMINSKIKNWSTYDLNNIRFNELLACEKIELFDSNQISMLLGPIRDENVFNLEFDANLSSIDPVDLKSVISSIEGEDEPF